ncbi:hypothetical protein BU14_0074s0030 [Porphyra umbilicalis]|uniref:Uncharacterized protein n=1 Tax=Porphyra umbilicalis TaxID=2786 RepID=A0A1X6PFH6_PORUM|nr:hypothetical protein BU14_0074s0030 [Porphyra umbilicalis]|eukprot:OSX79599.1 hypothetical protein BU14_0074s0030 [Porphyra umbilicalis]
MSVPCAAGTNSGPFKWRGAPPSMARRGGERGRPRAKTKTIAIRYHGSTPTAWRLPSETTPPTPGRRWGVGAPARARPRPERPAAVPPPAPHASTDAAKEASAELADAPKGRALAHGGAAAANAARLSPRTPPTTHDANKEAFAPPVQPHAPARLPIDGGEGVCGGSIFLGGGGDAVGGATGSGGGGRATHRRGEETPRWARAARRAAGGNLCQPRRRARGSGRGRTPRKRSHRRPRRRRRCGNGNDGGGDGGGQRRREPPAGSPLADGGLGRHPVNAAVEAIHYAGRGGVPADANKAAKGGAR